MPTPYKTDSERLSELQSAVENWIEVTMVNYNDRQYGKGALKDALGKSMAMVPDGWMPTPPVDRSCD